MRFCAQVTRACVASARARPPGGGARARARAPRALHASARAARGPSRSRRLDICARAAVAAAGDRGARAVPSVALLPRRGRSECAARAACLRRGFGDRPGRAPMRGDGCRRSRARAGMRHCHLCAHTERRRVVHTYGPLHRHLESLFDVRMTCGGIAWRWWREGPARALARAHASVRCVARAPRAAARPRDSSAHPAGPRHTACAHQRTHSPEQDYPHHHHNHHHHHQQPWPR